MIDAGRPASVLALYTAALQGERCELHGRFAGPEPLPVPLWAGRVTSGDRALLSRCREATLDVGCGPGRLTRALAEGGHPVLGIDIVPEAVRQTRARGAMALLRDVFEPLPAEGRWGSLLLADGNIGIGGDPRALLERAAQVLAPRGRVVADLSGPGTGLTVEQLILRTGDRVSTSFPWASVGVDAIGSLAVVAGFVLEETARHGDRWFAVLRKED